MNIQTERLENHKARFTVEVEPERLDKAKQSAARTLAKRVNVPGFRKGKAPYKILVSYVGEAAILEDAMELLGNEVYKEAMDQAEIDPFGPGELEDFKLDPNPTFVFTVDLQPTVELGDYRSIRETYEPPVVDDAAVDRSLKLMQEEQAVVEESSKPAALGDRVTIDIHSFFTDGEQDAEADSEDAVEADAVSAAEVEPESEDSDEHDDHDHHHHNDDEVFVHQHDAVLRLEEGDNEPLLPGFAAALVGAVVGETKEFDLTVPDNDEDFDEKIAGRPVKFSVTVKKIETMTLPVLNDDFAARVTENEEQPLSLLELRMRVRENLEKEAERRAKSTFANTVLDKVVEQATVSYPEALVLEQSEEFLKDLDRRLRQEGLTLEDYMKVLNKTKEDLLQDYREPAVRSVERQLVMLNLLGEEKLQVADAEIEQEIDKMLEAFGEQGASLRSVFGSKQMRSNIANDLLTQKLYDRLSAIATNTLEEETHQEQATAEDVDQPEADESTDAAQASTS